MNPRNYTRGLMRSCAGLRGGARNSIQVLSFGNHHFVGEMLAVQKPLGGSGQGIRR